ncbi:cytochrome c [Thiomicrorhabdus chilensis]|uniref:cytochrome c n=1 Tax=Thiomicrorhabdus chilensis TaxID=63656 RepID=UPI00056FB9DF|nr:cytochrome c [Thiomicrorhabdus chilensis]
MRHNTYIGFFLIYSLLTGLWVSNVQAEDKRTTIWLSETERNTVLEEMRQFLVASQAILQGTLDEDIDKVETAAREVGLKQLRGMSAELSAKLPQEFKAWGPQVHQEFEEIANEAATLGDANEILNRLAKLQTLCIQCHATYRLERD